MSPPTPERTPREPVLCGGTIQEVCAALEDAASELDKVHGATEAPFLRDAVDWIDYARAELARLRAVSAAERLTPQMRNMMAREADVIEKARRVKASHGGPGIIHAENMAALLDAVDALDAASPEPPTEPRL